MWGEKDSNLSRTVVDLDLQIQMAHANRYYVSGIRPNKCPTKNTPSISFNIATLHSKALGVMNKKYLRRPKSPYLHGGNDVIV